MPWRSDFYGDLVDTKLPKAMGMVDGEPAYFDVRGWVWVGVGGCSCYFGV